MIKPWFKSTAILGALGSALGWLSQPDVLNILPKNVASIVTVVGGVAAVFGLRRAIPDATLMQTDSGTVAIHDPSGVLVADLSAKRNVWGETPEQEARRRTIMDAEGAVLKETLAARESAGSKGPQAP